MLRWGKPAACAVWWSLRSWGTCPKVIRRFPGRIIADPPSKVKPKMKKIHGRRITTSDNTSHGEPTAAIIIRRAILWLSTAVIIGGVSKKGLFSRSRKCTETRKSSDKNAPPGCTMAVIIMHLTSRKAAPLYADRTSRTPSLTRTSHKLALSSPSRTVRPPPKILSDVVVSCGATTSDNTSHTEPATAMIIRRWPQDEPRSKPPAELRARATVARGYQTCCHKPQGCPILPKPHRPTSAGIIIRRDRTDRIPSLSYLTARSRTDCHHVKICGLWQLGRIGKVCGLWQLGKIER